MEGNTLVKNIVILFCLGGVFLRFCAQAFAFSTFYLDPKNKYIEVGQSQSVDLRLNTDNEAVNAYSAFISYPSDRVDISIKDISSTFSIIANQSFGGGSIEISAGSISPVNGDTKLATLQLTGKKEGTATVSFGGNSAVPKYSDSSDSLSLSRSIGGFYTITAKENEAISPTPTPLIIVPTITRSYSRPTYFYPTLSIQVLPTIVTPTLTPSKVPAKKAPIVIPEKKPFFQDLFDLTREFRRQLFGF